MSQDVLNFDNLMLESYGENQDIQLDTTVEDNGSTLKLVGNGWKKVDFSYTITADSILEFKFKSSAEGEIHGLGFDIDDNLSPDSFFNLYGTQNWGISDFDNYQISTEDSWTYYSIRVGDFFTGDVSYLTFANDHDIDNPNAESIFSDIRIYENQTPVASDDSINIQQNETITILKEDLLVNDSDADGNSLEIIGVNNPLNGEVFLDSNGYITFTPDANFSGATSFDYTVSDGNGSFDTATVTINVEVPIISNSDIVESSNIIGNGSFTTTNEENIFNSNTGTTYSTDAGIGWIVPKKHKWNFDGTNEWAYTDNTGAGGLIQVINDDGITQGAQKISFDATNIGADNTLKLKIYGIDGEFKIGNWDKNASVISLDGSPINVDTLLDTDNIATEEFDWKTFSWDSLDFGSGYEYIALVFWTDGVDETDFQAIDNVAIEPIEINHSPQAYDDHFVTQTNNSLSILGSDLLANDIDTHGQILQITEVTNASNGSVSLDSQGNILFNPNADFAGVASFEYTIQNGQGLLDQATVTINVTSPVAEPIEINHPPQAYDDHFVARTNNSLSILGSDLLVNDVDTHGQILQITEVTNASNGSVSLDSQGNIFFNPNADFAGVASFEYTIQNGQGLLDQATVTINVTSPVPLGTNLDGIHDWSTQVPFVDRFKSSRKWITQANGVWDTKEYDLLDLDENGWVKSLPALEDAPQYTDVSTIFTSIDQGRYIVLYEGEGEIEYQGGKIIGESSSVEGRDVIDIGSNENLIIKITETDPNATGNYIRNIQLIPEAHESTYQTQTFNPTFLEKTQPFGALRFMDWMKTNNSTQGEWSERPTLDSSTWSALGAPVEIMVEVANTLDVDAWFTMPHLATDEYVTNFATYVRDNLEPERNVYVEYSNEVWNWQFQQTGWVDQQAKNDPNFNGNRMNWFGKRTTEITQIWDQVFEQTGDKERVIGVMGSQAANTWMAEQALKYESWSTENKTHADYGIDAIAIAPYFGGYLGSPKNETEVEKLTVDQLFDELTQGGVLSNGYSGGALQQAYDNIANYADLAQEEGLQLLAYEGGQHLAGHGGVQNNQTITDLFIEANRDPRMGELYKEYFANWYQQGGGLFMNFSDVGIPSKWGSWGSLESIDQDSSPKYDALIDLIENGIQTAP